jgi:Phosphotransferase enzyme family
LAPEPIELVSDEPWSTVWRLAVGRDVLWLKHCKDDWAFEPRLTAALASRWPDRVPEVVAHDAERSWLLTRDAGRQLLDDPEPWPEVMRLYAELQQGEVGHADEHVAAGVPDLRLAALPERYAQLLEEVDDERLGRFEPRFAELCAELAARGVPETIQHDDLHQFNIYVRDGRPRILDWGDSSVGHPYFSLVATLRHVDDRGISRAFLAAWGGDEATLELALRVGRIAHAFKQRPRDVPDEDWPRVVALAIAQTGE